MAELKQIRLEKWVSTKDGSGDFKETVTKYNLWAEVTRQGGSRISLSGRTALSESYEFKMQFRPDFKPSGNCRIVYDGKRYTVTSIRKDEEKRFKWVFSCDGK